MAALAISVQNVEKAGTNMLLVHADSIFVGLAVFQAQAPCAWGVLVLILSIINILLMLTNFVGSMLGCAAGLIALAKLKV